MKFFMIITLGLLTILPFKMKGNESSGKVDASSKTVEVESLFDNILKPAQEEHLSISTVKANGCITKALTDLLNLKQALLPLESPVAKAHMIRVENAIEILSQRRLYKYQLWAEQRLETCQEYFDKNKKNEKKLQECYMELGSVQQDLIVENMLRREIAQLMSDIYDRLSFDHKKEVRHLSIRLWQDTYSLEQDSNQNSITIKRYALEDF